MLSQRILGLFILVALLAGCTALPDTPPTGIPEQSTPEQGAEPEAPPQAMPAEISLVERAFAEESDQPPYEIDARWPNLAGDAAFAVTFNAELDQRVDAGLSDFKAVVAERGDSPEFEVLSTLALDYEVTYLSDGLVSVYLIWDTYIAISAHPFPSSQALNFDAHQGRFINLGDLFAPEADPVSVILDRVEPELLRRDLGTTAGAAEQALEAREHWNLLPEGLRINFDVYEVGPYAAGPQFVFIPWADLAPYLKADSPFGGEPQAGFQPVHPAPEGRYGSNIMMMTI